MLFRWCTLSSVVPWGDAMYHVAGVGHWYSLCWFFDTLSALRVFKCHLSLVPSPPYSAPLHVPTPQIHFIDFKRPPVCLTPSPPSSSFSTNSLVWLISSSPDRGHYKALPATFSKCQTVQRYYFSVITPSHLYPRRCTYLFFFTSFSPCSTKWLQDCSLFFSSGFIT